MPMWVFTHAGIAPANSCMGLYPRYVRSLQNGLGACFAASTPDGRVIRASDSPRPSRTTVTGVLIRSTALSISALPRPGRP